MWYPSDKEVELRQDANGRKAHTFPDKHCNLMENGNGKL